MSAKSSCTCSKCIQLRKLICALKELYSCLLAYLYRSKPWKKQEVLVKFCRLKISHINLQQKLLMHVCMCECACVCMSLGNARQCFMLVATAATSCNSSNWLLIWCVAQWRSCTHFGAKLQSYDAIYLSKIHLLIFCHAFCPHGPTVQLQHFTFTVFPAAFPRRGECKILQHFRVAKLIGQRNRMRPTFAATHWHISPSRKGHREVSQKVFRTWKLPSRKINKL